MNSTKPSQANTTTGIESLDWLNAITVIELQQATRNNFLVVAYLFVLFAFFFFTLHSYSPQNDQSPNAMAGNMKGLDGKSIEDSHRDWGAQVFLWLYLVVIFSSHLLLPMISSSSFGLQYRSAEASLLQLTGLSAYSIVNGKIFTAAIYSLVLYSAVAPFLLFAYFLGGVDLLSIFLALVFGFVSLMTCVQVMLAVNCIRDDFYRPMFSIVGIVVSFCLATGLVVTVLGIIYFPYNNRLSPNNSPVFRWILAFFCWTIVYAYLISLCYPFAVGVISPARLRPLPRRRTFALAPPSVPSTPKSLDTC